MASRNLGTLSIDVIAKTGGFVAGMEKAARSASTNFGKIRKVASDSAKIIGAGLAATAGIVLAWTNSTINAAVEIERLSGLANTTTDNFQRWAIGASTVGIEQQKLADILKDTQDKVGDFLQTGGGALADFFENIAPKVGVTADEFRRLSGPDALQLYVSSLEKAKISQSDMIFYLEAIASDSSLLLPLLRNNGEAMGEWGERAAELGAILGDDTINGAKKAKEDFQELGLIFTGIKNRIVAEVIPSFANMKDSLFDTGNVAKNLDTVSRIAATGIKLLASAGVIIGGVFKTAGDLIGGTAAVIVQFLSGDFRAVANTTSDIRMDAFANAKATADAVSALWKDTVDETISTPPTPPDTRNLSAPFSKAAKEIEGEFEKTQKKIQGIIDSIQEDIDTFGLTSSEKTVFDLMALGATNAQIETAKLGLATRDWLDVTIEGMEEIERLEEDRNERFRDALGSIQEEIALMGMSIEQQEIYNNLKWAGVEAESERGKQIIESTRLLQQQRDSIQDQVAVMDSVRDVGRGFITDLASGSKTFKDSFIDALDAIRSRLIALAAEKIIEQIFGANGSSSGGNTGTFAAFFGSLLGGSRANGGPVSAGSLYEVGENGRPEILTDARGKQYLIPGNNSNVSPVGAGGGTGSPNFAITINIEDGASSQQQTGDTNQAGKELVGLVQGVVERWWLKQNKAGGTVYRERIGS